jgi:hypothetical protein
MADLYEPLDWQRRVGYAAATKFPDGKPRCRARVHTGRVGFNQCGNRGKVQGEGGFWWCATHDPAAEAKRAAAASAKHEAEQAASRRRWALQAGAREFLDALRAIRAGHNDPRTLATEVLAKFPELEE